jgi:MerR family copper efflux transcriptional regulator
VDTTPTDDRTVGKLQIGEVAGRTDLSLRSLRHWEEIGLLHPSARSDGGFRLYSEDDVERVMVIRRMKPLGFTLDQMKSAMAALEVLRAAADDETERRAARARLAEVRQDASERRENLVRQLEMADEFIDLIAREVDR